MRIGFNSGLLLQNLLVILLIVIIVFVPSNALRIILGLPLVLLFPGYTLILALFPKKDQIGNVERVALSFGLSIAVVPLIGLILNYTPLGITLESTLYSITGFIFIISIIAWVRLRKLDDSDRFKIDLKIKRLNWTGNKWDKIISVIMIASILGAIGVLGYVLATPKLGEKFTAFYVLGPEGKATNYPTEISTGDEATVILGIVNHEQEATTYRIEILMNGAKNNEFGPINLENEGKWEETISFTPYTIGDNQKVDFLLYKGEQSEAYRTLHLWVDVHNK